VLIALCAALDWESPLRTSWYRPTIAERVDWSGDITTTTFNINRLVFSVEALPVEPMPALSTIWMVAGI
jgi:hypothetical protein